SAKDAGDDDSLAVHDDAPLGDSAPVLMVADGSVTTAIDFKVRCCMPFCPWLGVNDGPGPSL
ncbi:MAG: hypothetical protein JJT90_09545, partial [Ectothiorhodospiraceae bacterium]|nr:hypothetical protein [Ectothiorhodospiraceae bacterium]